MCIHICHGRRVYIIRVMGTKLHGAACLALRNSSGQGCTNYRHSPSITTATARRELCEQVYCLKRGSSCDAIIFIKRMVIRMHVLLFNRQLYQLKRDFSTSLNSVGH